MDFGAFLALQRARVLAVPCSGGRRVTEAQAALRRHAHAPEDGSRVVAENNSIRKAYRDHRLLDDWIWVPPKKRGSG